MNMEGLESGPEHLFEIGEVREEASKPLNVHNTGSHSNEDLPDVPDEVEEVPYNPNDEKISNFSPLSEVPDDMPEIVPEPLDTFEEFEKSMERIHDLESTGELIDTEVAKAEDILDFARIAIASAQASTGEKALLIPESRELLDLQAELREIERSSIEVAQEKPDENTETISSLGDEDEAKSESSQDNKASQSRSTSRSTSYSTSYEATSRPTQSQPENEQQPRSQAETVETVEGEVVFHQGEWIREDVDSQTKEWLNGHGYENVSAGFTPEEQQEADEYVAAMYNRGRRMQDEEDNEMDPLEAVKKVGENEDESETLKLLLRVAIKVGTKAAVIIARNMAKDRDIPQELRIALGIFADTVDEGSKFMDKVISGEDKPNLERDCISFLKSKFSAE